MEKVLSVPIPSYNVEKFLENTLDSFVIKSVLQDIEILIVDDGSTDESAAVIQNYATKDPRIRLIQKKSGGCASARNKGIECAKGRYIGFVDSDDFVDETMFLSTVINLIKNACEAFNDCEQDREKLIKISSRIENDNVVIQVMNNAKPIAEPEKIFEEGMTTKASGSGLGLYICKKNTEDQCGQLNLVKSDENSTVFELRFCL